MLSFVKKFFNKKLFNNIRIECNLYRYELIIFLIKNIIKTVIQEKIIIKIKYNNNISHNPPQTYTHIFG